MDQDIRWQQRLANYQRALTGHYHALFCQLADRLEALRDADAD